MRYRVDCITDQDTQHQYLFESDEDLTAEMHPHPRYAAGVLTMQLHPAHPLITLPLHGEDHPHGAVVLAEPACRCSVLMETVEAAQSGQRDREGNPAKGHTARHARDIADFVRHVEADGRHVVGVELSRIPEPTAGRSWLTN